jgi:hypothetical protein
MAYQAVHRECRPFRIWKQVMSCSEIVKQPDHHPWIVKQAVDVAEDSVDQGFHDAFPSWLWRQLAR